MANENDLDTLRSLADVRDRVARVEVNSLLDRTEQRLETIEAMQERLGNLAGTAIERAEGTEERVARLALDLAQMKEQNAQLKEELAQVKARLARREDEGTSQSVARDSPPPASLPAAKTSTGPVAVRRAEYERRMSALSAAASARSEGHGASGPRDSVRAALLGEELIKLANRVSGLHESARAALLGAELIKQVNRASELHESARAALLREEFVKQATGVSELLGVSRAAASRLEDQRRINRALSHTSSVTQTIDDQRRLGKLFGLRS